MGSDKETHKTMTEKIVKARAWARVLFTRDFAEPRGAQAQAGLGLGSAPDSSPISTYQIAVRKRRNRYV
jgi:hypothetical protein